MKALLPVLSVFISMAVFGQQDDCNKFRNGKFKIIGDQGQEYIIVRNGSKQIEYDVLNKSQIELTVVWIDSCTYTLQFKKEISKTGKHTFSKDMILTVVILEYKEYSYLQRTSSNLYETILEGEVFQID